MNFSHFIALINIVEYGSITSAANHLYISPVSLKQQLDSFESELGFQVFNRSRKGCTLTHAGKMLYDGARKSLTCMEHLLAECRKNPRSLHVCLYSPYEFANYFEDYKNSSEINIQFVVWKPYDRSLRHEWMKKQQIDFLQSGYSPEMNLQGLSFLPVQMDLACCYFTHNSPLSKKKNISIDDLDGYDVYSFSDPSYVIDHMEHQFALRGQALYRVPFSDSTVMNLCSEGAVFILEGLVSKILPYLSCVPFTPVHPCIHGLVYFSDANRDVLDFVEYLTGWIQQDAIDKMMRLFQKCYLSDSPITQPI